MKFIIIFFTVAVIGTGVFFLFTSKDNSKESSVRQEDSQKTGPAKDVVSPGETLVNKIEGSDAGSQGEGVKKDKAPLLTLKDYDGKEVNLSDFIGQNVIINSWAVWCPFCVKELKDFAQLERELADDVVIIAINRAESLNKAKGYTDNLGVTGDMIFLLDPRDSFYKSIGAFSMPETIFVDTEGGIVFHKRGPMSLDEMRSKAQELFGI